MIFRLSGALGLFYKIFYHFVNCPLKYTLFSISLKLLFLCMAVTNVSVVTVTIRTLLDVSHKNIF